MLRRLPHRLPWIAEDHIHDPSQLVIVDGQPTLYASGTRGNGLNRHTLNPETGRFERAEPAFGQEKPSWVSGVQVWNATGEFDAPDLASPTRIYFTVFDEIPGRIQDSIGTAVLVETRQGTAWIDEGIVLQSVGEENHPRAMDASVFTDFEGRSWMVFGSHAGGIYIVELDPTTGRLRQSADHFWTSPGRMVEPGRFTHLASHWETEGENSIEAAYIYPRNGWYYLFVNWDGCCNSVASTYNIRVGRSRNPTGPYLDRQGRPLAEGGGILFLGREDRFIGPGHAGILRWLEWGVRPRYLFTFHYYDGEDLGKAKLGGRELTWNSEGWPELGQLLIGPED